MRKRLAPWAPKPARPVGRGRLRYELPLPWPEDAVRTGTARRDALIIEVPGRLLITRLLREGGVSAHEPATASVMLGVAERLRPDVVFDVGANIGPHGFLVPALLDVPVVAFEPTAAVAAALQHIVELNNLPCTVVATAVGEQNETATLYISPTDTTTSLRAGFRDPKREASVAVQSLDSYIRASGLTPGLVKIDTETTEPAVLRGATRLLESRPWIVCEILPGWTEAEIESLLLPLGYRAFQITDALPLPRMDAIVGHASFQDANWLFAPEDPDEGLWSAIGRWRRAIDACAPGRDLPPLTTRRDS